jgi:hypothetical protein
LADAERKLEAVAEMERSLIEDVRLTSPQQCSRHERAIGERAIAGSPPKNLGRPPYDDRINAPKSVVDDGRACVCSRSDCVPKVRSRACKAPRSLSVIARFRRILVITDLRAGDGHRLLRAAGCDGRA